MICEICKAEGNKSRVFLRENYSEGLMGGNKEDRHYYDEEGEYHDHAVLTHRKVYECSNKHSLKTTLSTGSNCKVKGCTFKVQSQETSWGHSAPRTATALAGLSSTTLKSSLSSMQKQRDEILGPTNEHEMALMKSVVEKLTTDMEWLSGVNFGKAVSISREFGFDERICWVLFNAKRNAYKKKVSKIGIDELLAAIKCEFGRKFELVERENVKKL